VSGQVIKRQIMEKIVKIFIFPQIDDTTGPNSHHAQKLPA
jgi:hypothetical protein